MKVWTICSLWGLTTDFNRVVDDLFRRSCFIETANPNGLAVFYGAKEGDVGLDVYAV